MIQNIRDCIWNNPSQAPIFASTNAPISSNPSCTALIVPGANPMNPCGAPLYIFTIASFPHMLLMARSAYFPQRYREHEHRVASQTDPNVEADTLHHPLQQPASKQATMQPQTGRINQKEITGYNSPLRPHHNRIIQKRILTPTRKQRTRQPQPPQIPIKRTNPRIPPLLLRGPR
jgi:hypothetical protein